MLTPNALRNLIDGGRFTVLSIVGISFAIILIFMQLGFLGAVLDTAVLFYNNLKFDLVARSPDYYHIADPKHFPRQRLIELKNVAGVADVQPLHISLGTWNYAEKSVQQAMLFLGVDASGQPFSPATTEIIAPPVDRLISDRSMVVDQKSRPNFLGKENTGRFSDTLIGLEVELNGQSFRIEGTFKMGTGLAANGAAVVNETGFERLFPGLGHEQVSLGLIQLNEADARNLEEVRARIYRSLSGLSGGTPPLEILTHEEANLRERTHWVWNTPVGFIFLAGVVISFLVGSIIVYIVLSADISRLMRQYATLKAMGYGNGYLYRMVLEQAIILGLASYFIAVLVSLLLYHYVGEAANLPITMTLDREIMVFFASLLMCSSSAMIAIGKLRKADPADLY